MKALKRLELRNCQAATEDEAEQRFSGALNQLPTYPPLLGPPVLHLLMTQHVVEAANSMPNLFWLGLNGWDLDAEPMVRCARLGGS